MSGQGWYQLGAEPSVEDLCRNCESPLTGLYCAQCGQRAAPPNPTTRELAAEAWESFTNVDGKIVLTLRDLMRHPGRLTREYLSGRRVRYLPPVRLYLICSVAYFVLAAAEEKIHPDRDGDRKGVVRVTETDDKQPTGKARGRGHGPREPPPRPRTVQWVDGGARAKTCSSSASSATATS